MRNVHTLFAASFITLLGQGCSLQKWDEINEGNSAGSGAESSAHTASSNSIGGAKATSSAAMSSRGGSSNAESHERATGGGNSTNAYSSQASGGNSTTAEGGSNNAGSSNAGGDATASAAKCEPGKRTCSNGAPQLCSSDGTWKAETACTGSTPTCVSGTCGCTPGTRKCAADQKTPQLCGESGSWQDEAACDAATPICTGSGACGICTEGERKCDGATPQLCSNKGQWEAQTTCTGSNVCREGACVACPGTGGPTMVGLPLGFCIDSTEVTRAQYRAWLTTDPMLVNQVSICTWNDSYVPATDFTMPLTKPNYPVSSVDWCDAYAYCKGVGKHLCGKIAGGSLVTRDLVDAKQSQWYAACTSNGTNQFVYGNSYQGTACATADAGTGTVAVATNSGCQSSVPGFAGVFDLSGNVSEWIDGCTYGTLEHPGCVWVGGYWGSYGDSSRGPDASCTSAMANVGINSTDPTVGFRCCAF